MNIEKLTSLMESNEFAEKLYALETIEEAQAFLKENGVELTLEELNAWAEYLRSTNSQGELNEDDLDDVAGGLIRIIGRPIPFPFPKPVPRPHYPWNRIW